MKTLKNTLGTILMTALLITSCNKNEDAIIFENTPATAQEFAALKENALDNLKQNFNFNAEDGVATFISEKGVTIEINGSCLTLDGNAVAGNVDLEFVELFEKGNMLTTNKTTMGILPNGDRAMLISGGEFLVNATQNGAKLETTCGFQLKVPTNLTGGDDNAMLPWKGILDENDNIEWVEDDGRDGTKGGEVFVGDGANGGNQYYSFFNDFGWSNVDRFYNDPRPKTTILAAVPEGYDNANSVIYLSYDGEDTGLAKLDTYDAGTKLFSEHYGQIPVGLECHVIFASEEDDQWKYAIKQVTIVADGIITFTEEETSLATESELTTIINGLP